MTQAIQDQRLGRFRRFASGPGRLLRRPRTIALVCVGVLAAAGWTYLGLLAGDMVKSGHGEALGPGMGWLATLVEALCRPTFGASSAHAGMPGTGAWSPVDFGLILLMWCAMALAMMLPTAGPMIVTYSEIAETASAKGEPVVSPLVLAAGYTAVWIGFAVAATALQWSLAQLALLDPAMRSTSVLFSGAVFAGAGLYQFSALKYACVTQCQRPFPFFFAHWTSHPEGVFRLGVRQGLYCLGCCWAMMLVMLTVGLMNIVWMAALGAVMAIEKILTTTRFSRAIGVVLIGTGVLLIVSSIVAHWPARTV